MRHAPLFLHLTVALLIAPAAFSQTGPAYVPHLTFDVASVRQSPPLTGGFTVFDRNPSNNSNYSATNFSIGNLILSAYGIFSYQLSGEPDWGRTMFDVTAKSDAAVDEALSRLPVEQAKLEKLHMVQVLLADRFHLKAHWETQEHATFDLLAGKSGPKLKPYTPEPEIDSSGNPKPKVWPLRQSCDARGCQIIATGMSISTLAEILGSQLQGTVTDKTGITGTYSFMLQYQGKFVEETESDGKSYPALGRAVQDQLGLKLSPTKSPVQVLVVDHIEKPTDN